AVATAGANDGDDGDVSRKEGEDLLVLGPQRRVFGQRLYQGFGQNHQTGASDADPSEADPGAQESELKRRLRLAMAQQEPHDKNRGEAGVFVPSERCGLTAMGRLGERRAGT